jgi:hypothetical protein
MAKSDMFHVKQGMVSKEEYSFMNISVEKLLAKIEEELSLASGESLREKVYSIKILCELILEEYQPKREVPMTRITPQPAQVFPDVNQPKKMDLDNEANGDSLFDF